MSLGFGIFLSTVIISLLLLYRWTRDQWNWRKGLKRIFLGFIALFAILGVTIWIFSLYQNRLIKQTSYYDVSLGMTKLEVEYIKGVPTNIYKEPEKTGDGWWLQEVVPIANIERGKRFQDFDSWSYDLGSHERLDIEFDKNSGKVTTITCFSGNSYCESILGISTESSEEDVLKRLGKPDKARLSGTTKRLYYPDLNLAVYLKQKKVYMFVILTNESWLKEQNSQQPEAAPPKITPPWEKYEQLPKASDLFPDKDNTNIQSH